MKNLREENAKRGASRIQMNIGSLALAFAKEEGLILLWSEIITQLKLQHEDLLLIH